MTQNSAKKLFRVLLILASLVPGILIFLGYKYGQPYSGFQRFGLTTNAKDISILVATFSFSMLGFLATVITIITALNDKLRFKVYKRKGYLEDFLFFYFLTILNLFVGFVIAIIKLGGNIQPVVFDVMMIVFTNSLIQTFIIGFIIYNLLRHTFRRISR